MVRPLYEIAQEIRDDYASRAKPVYFGAVPYLNGITNLDKMTDFYGCEDGHDIVPYLLSNLTTWRGETARRVKAELKGMLRY